MRVCILGAGLTSYTLAKALVNQNIYVDIITQTKKNLPYKSRTIGISKSNVEFFNKSIINIDKISWKLNKIDIYSDNLNKEKLIHFENDGNELFSIIKNQSLFEILEKSLSKRKYFKKKTIRINFDNLNNYDLVINTEHSNLITKKFFYKKIIKEYNSLAYTTIMKHSDIDNKTAIQIFTKNGPLAFLPISKNQTSVVYSIQNTDIKKENIKELICHYNFKYNIKNIEKISSFDLKSISLRSYYHKNILAFGDILHKIHPLAGQGFNMTVRDVKVILELIKKRIDLGLSVDKSINREFEKILKHKNYIFSNGIDIIHGFFNFERKLQNNILSKSVKLISKNPSINKFFTKIADRGIIF